MTVTYVTNTFERFIKREPFFNNIMKNIKIILRRNKEQIYLEKYSLPSFQVIFICLPSLIQKYAQDRRFY